MKLPIFLFVILTLKLDPLVAIQMNKISIKATRLSFGHTESVTRFEVLVTSFVQYLSILILTWIHIFSRKFYVCYDFIILFLSESNWWNISFIHFFSCFEIHVSLIYENICQSKSIFAPNRKCMNWQE